MYGGALSVAPHQVPDEGHWQEGRNRRVLRACAVSHLGELGRGHRRKAHAALEPRRLGRENHRQRRHVLLTPFGSKRAISIRRLPETSKWNADFLQTVRGLPWNTMETEVEKVTTVDVGKSRRLYITRAMITESGVTPGVSWMHRSPEVRR